MTNPEDAVCTVLHTASFLVEVEMINRIQTPDPALRKIIPPVRMKEGAAYVRSRFVLQFTHHGIPYSFHTLTKECIEGGTPARAEGCEEVADLIAGQFLVPEDKDEGQYYASVSTLFRTLTRKKGFGSFTILPTLGCNARCVYCYEAGREQVSMYRRVEERLIRFILENRQEGPVKLHWFGGEPMLRPDLIERVCGAMRDAQADYRSSMVSNGSLITPELAETMVNSWKLDRIQISMDGAEEDYIARKRYRTYRDDYHTVLRAVDALARAGVRVLVRCNADRENADRLPLFLSDLRDAVADKTNVSVQVTPIAHGQLLESDLEVRKKLLDVLPMIEQAGFGFVYGYAHIWTFSANHCMADGGDVVIGPDGSLFACEQCVPQSRFGDIWNGVTDEAARRAFCRADRIREKCRTCPFLPDCTGFSSCPVEDTLCREVRRIYSMEALKRMIDRHYEKQAGTGSGSEREDGPFDC